MSKVPVLITTEKRGVFTALIDQDQFDEKHITAEEVRMVVYWSTEMKGLLGLAKNGPDKGCRVTSAVSRALLRDVTAVIEISDSALKKFRKEPWG